MESHRKLALERPARFDHLDTKFLLKRPLLLMVRQSPAWLDADERIQVAPNCKIWSFAEVNFNLLSGCIVSKDNDTLINIDKFQKESSRQFKRLDRPGATILFKLKSLAAQKIAGRQVTPVATPRKDNTGILNRRNRKAGV